jgi:hypothetical protein
MGYYIGVINGKRLPVTGKAKALLDHGDVIEVRFPQWDPEDKKNALICVVENGPFDAAAVIFSKGEFDAFYNDDISDSRPRRWLLMDRKKAFEVANVPSQFF